VRSALRAAPEIEARIVASRWSSRRSARSASPDVHAIGDTGKVFREVTSGGYRAALEEWTRERVALK
jgi:hypothetical protein